MPTTEHTVLCEAQREQARETLQRLLALTPNPPTELEPTLLIDRGAAMLDTRETEFRILRLLLEREPELLRGDLECRKLRDAIALQDRRWCDALSWARGELSKRRLAAQRARQAQRAYRKSA